jgi:hypothetical protein
VFACHSILDAQHGLCTLESWGYAGALRAISGKFGSSGVLRALSTDLLGTHLPIFDSLDYESSPEGISALSTCQN